MLSVQGMDQRPSAQVEGAGICAVGNHVSRHRSVSRLGFDDIAVTGMGIGKRGNCTPCTMGVY